MSARPQAGIGADVTRPVIGVTAYREPARWGSWDATAVLVPDRYVGRVAAAGGLPVVVPPDEAVADSAPDLLPRLDGLLLVGGADVDPARYGQSPHPRAETPRPVRDQAELSLVRAALDADLPLLGICRGMQVMAVAFGGALNQHLPDVVRHERHRPAPGVYGRHGARFAAGSLAAAILGESLEVNSYHHQAVSDPGKLTVTGWADDDTVETLEDPTRRFALGVQWHPEQDEDLRLFEALVRAASVRAV